MMYHVIISKSIKILKFRLTMEIQGEEQGVVVTELHRNVNDIFLNIEKLEQRMSKIEQFYSSTRKKLPNADKASSFVKDKNKDKQITIGKRWQLDAPCREAAAAKRMQDLMHQFYGILNQHIIYPLQLHKWAGPFMQPVDVVGLGLHDYYEVIKKPMDFSRIKHKMEAKDGTGYKNVREICADVRLIFKNAMKYNDEKDDVHVMAKTLMVKLEEKWLQLLPKVIEEDERRKKEDAEAELEMQLAHEVDHAKMARELSFELNEVDLHLKKLKEVDERRKKEDAEAELEMQLAHEVDHAKMARELSFELNQVDLHLKKLKEVVLSNCRKISFEEKRTLVKILTELSPDDLQKALLIVSQNSPNFEATCDEVELDMDTQSESILWKLKFFLRDIIEVLSIPDAKFAMGKSNIVKLADEYIFIHLAANSNSGSNVWPCDDQPMDRCSDVAAWNPMKIIRNNWTKINFQENEKISSYLEKSSQNGTVGEETRGTAIGRAQPRCQGAQCLLVSARMDAVTGGTVSCGFAIAVKVIKRTISNGIVTIVFAHQ
ncbi:Bromodomain-containing protein [Artemisia annua]|uniref:Bromodomain-containing protein n=1 Tax=Artemisia annua TaxID=35608 RepID=A0A2U1L5K3_ARTAN|nr:Bromodomain-containing protein [Artemisia annua]